MKIVKLLFPFLLVSLASCSFISISNPYPYYDSTALLMKHSEINLEDMLENSEMIIQSNSEFFKYNYLTYLDSVITDSLLSSNLSNLVKNENNPVIIDTSSADIKELSIKYAQDSDYLILITPDDAFNYYSYADYSGSSMGANGMSTGGGYEYSAIDTNHDYADSTTIFTERCTRIETNLKIYSVKDDSVAIEYKIINVEFNTKHPFVKRIVRDMPELIIENLDFLKYETRLRELIIKFRLTRFLEVEEILELAELYNLSVTEKKYDYVLTKGKRKARIDKKNGLKRADILTIRELERITIKDHFCPSGYHENYEMPVRKKIPIVIDLDNYSAKEENSPIR